MFFCQVFISLEAIDPPNTRAPDAGSVSIDTPAKGNQSSGFARSVSLGSRPNFHIPGQKEALTAIETPEVNRAAVDGQEEHQDPVVGETESTSPSLEATTGS
jgi:hypothetical protein